MEDTCLLAMRCPVYRGRDSVSGFRMELENLTGDVKGKGTSGRTASPKVPMRQSGADCPVEAVKRSNSGGARGAGHPTSGSIGQLATGGTEWSGGRRQSSLGGTSRISREAYVRSCERLGVKFPGPTRRLRILKEQEELKKLRLAELRHEIAIGSEQADRGKFVDGAQTFAEIRRRSAKRKRAKG